MQTVTKQEIQRLTGLIVFSYGSLEVLQIVLKPTLHKLFLEKEMCAGYLRTICRSLISTVSS